MNMTSTTEKSRESGALAPSISLRARGPQSPGCRHGRSGSGAGQKSGFGMPIRCGGRIFLPYSKAYGEAGQAEQGLTALAEARAIVERTGERWWEAELHRVQGELLLQQAAGSGQRAEGEAETCFQQALDMARRSRPNPWTSGPL